MEITKKPTKPRFYVGSKAITIYDPAWFLTCFANHIFDPVITPMKVDKEGVLLYILQIRDNNTGKNLDVQWELPESISSSVKLQSDDNDELEAVWETNDQESNNFKADVNRCLEFWLKQIQQANTFGETPEIRFLGMTTVLKWPWKTSSNESYFKKFKSTDNTHVIRLGVGYIQSEYQIIGASMQLSSYTGNTVAAVQAKSASRKRKKAETSDGVEDESASRNEVNREIC